MKVAGGEYAAGGTSAEACGSYAGSGNVPRTCAEQASWVLSAHGLTLLWAPLLLDDVR